MLELQHLLADVLQDSRWPGEKCQSRTGNRTLILSEIAKLRPVAIDRDCCF